MFTLKNVMIAFLFLLSVILSGWSILTIKKHPIPRVKPTVSNQPDAFMEGVVAVVLNKAGVPALKITSPKMIHYPNNDTTRILSPHLTVYRNSPEPWLIQSDYAKAAHGVDEILFWSHVIIHHKKDIANLDTTLTTTTLTVFPKKETAETKAALTVWQPNTTVYAVGMLANMKAGTIKLLSQTRGVYVPSP